MLYRSKIIFVILQPYINMSDLLVNGWLYRITFTCALFLKDGWKIEGRESMKTAFNVREQHSMLPKRKDREGENRRERE